MGWTNRTGSLVTRKEDAQPEELLPVLWLTTHKSFKGQEKGWVKPLTLSTKFQHFRYKQVWFSAVLLAVKTGFYKGDSGRDKVWARICLISQNTCYWGSLPCFSILPNHAISMSNILSLHYEYGHTRTPPPSPFNARWLMSRHVELLVLSSNSQVQESAKTLPKGSRKRVW